MPYNNYRDFDKGNPKLQLALLNGINDLPSPSFLVYFNEESVVLDCLKLKFIGNHKVISTYSIPLEKVITMEVVASDKIDEIEQKYMQQLGLKSGIFNHLRETFRTLMAFDLQEHQTLEIEVLLSLAYYSASGYINDIVFAINNCGVDLAEIMARFLRIKLGIEIPNKPTPYFKNDKGEYVL